VNKHHVQLRRLPDDVLAKLKVISAEVVKSIAQDDELAQRIYRSYDRYRTQVMSYHEISERAYINARATQPPAH
jgi:TRAP-type mannitol/chloroaromatic compound transport system substrate-binding protein